jgi:hypothetical protein
MDCKNLEGSEELLTTLQGDNSCDRTNIQQAANVALNGANGSSGHKLSPGRKKRPPEDPPVQRVNEESMMQARFQEVCFTWCGFTNFTISFCTKLVYRGTYGTLLSL